jgi:hypothetical protein
VWLNETHIDVRISKAQSDRFPIQNRPEQEDVLTSQLFYIVLDNAIRKLQENQAGYHEGKHKRYNQ